MKNGSTKVTRARWESLDWEKQDTVLASALGVSRERVRQVRKELGQPRSPSHFQNTYAPVRRIERCLKRFASDKEMLPRHCLVAKFNTTHEILRHAGKTTGIEFAPRRRLLSLLPINWDLPDPALVRIWLKGIRCHPHQITQHRSDYGIRGPLWRLWKNRVVRGDKKAYRVALKKEVAKRSNVRISQLEPGRDYCVTPCR